MADDEPMDTNTTSTESETTRAPGTSSLVRPRQGRVVAGVAAGLATHFGFRLNLVRLGFAILTLFGGAGIVLYLAGWLLIRDETESTSIAERTVDNAASGGSWVGIVLLALAAVIVLDTLTFVPGSLLWATFFIVAGVLLYRGEFPGQGERQVPRREAAPTSEATATTPATPDTGPTDDDQADGSGGTGDVPPAPPQAYVPPTPPAPPTPRRPPSILGRVTMGVGMLALGMMAILDILAPAIDAQPRHYLALATITVGLGLIVGTWAGRGRWMILLGFFLIPPLLASPLAEVEWEDIDLTVSPNTIEDIEPIYDIRVGAVHFDLTDVEWDGETVDLDIDMGIGDLTVIVPEGVAVTGQAQVGIGAIETENASGGGFGDISRDLDIPGDRGQLNLDLELGVGMIELRVHDIRGEFEGMADSPNFDKIEPREDALIVRARSN